MIGDGGASGCGNDGTPGLWEKVWLPLGRLVRRALTRASGRG